MTGQNLLNKKLYKCLVKLFGSKGVNLVKPGEKGQFRYGKNRLSKKSRIIKFGDNPGEEYRVNCPFCGDTRGRLYINHIWGQLDKTSLRPMLWPVQCFNEQCMEDYQRRLDLYNLVFGDTVLDAIAVDEQVEEVEQRLSPVTYPGLTQDLSSILTTNPNHDVVLWCLARGFNPEELAYLYGVKYCDFHHVTYGANQDYSSKLVAPIYAKVDGRFEMVAWTARKIYDSTPGPKWLHSKGSISKVFYGLGAAAKYQTIVIVEGPGDKWSVGINAVALFGKTVNARRMAMLSSVINKRKNPKDSTVVVLLDPEQDPESRRSGRPHHIEQATLRLTQVLNCRVLPVYLPLGFDPGSLRRNYIWACIKKEAKKNGIIVSRSRKVVS
jgi:hypothetical protein